MRKRLQQAAELAASCRSPTKSFLLGCMALRADGAWVSSINSSVQNYGKAGHVPTPASHAEARVLRKAGKGAILFVARVLKDRQTWAMARPCSTCFSRILNSGVKRVYYTIGPQEYGVIDLVDDFEYKHLED